MSGASPQMSTNGCSVELEAAGTEAETTTPQKTVSRAGNETSTSSCSTLPETPTFFEAPISKFQLDAADTNLEQEMNGSMDEANKDDITEEHNKMNKCAFGMDYASLPIHALNRGQEELQDARLPLPTKDSGFPLPIRSYEDVEDLNEPRYDPNIHLALEDPEYVALLPDFRTIDPQTEQVPPVGTGTATDSAASQGQDTDSTTPGSKVAFTKTFRLLSAEGARVLKTIIQREKHRAHVNRRNQELRGLYYLSPFVRDLMTCPKLLEHLSKYAGEPLVPHFLSMNAPAVNFGRPSQQKVVDHWHYDSVAYVAVVLVSDLTDMVGGDLQVITKEKFEGIEMLNNAASSDTHARLLEDALVTVKYENTGCCIFAQGSEVLHHVTQLKEAKEDRLSFVMALQPANAFQPCKTVFDTWHRNFDAVDKTAPYEYARLSAQKLSHCLAHYVKHEPFSTSGETLTEKLRAVRDELTRTIDLLEDTEKDNIGYFCEITKRYVGEFK